MLKKKLRRGGAWLLAVCMVLGSVQLPALEAKAADGDNIALTAVATASDAETSNFTADKANDGSSDTGSRWASGTSEGEKWLQLAWDETQTMKSFAIVWERHNATDYEIAVSDNGAEWTTVWSAATAPVDLRQEITLDQAVTGKYARLNIHSYKSDSDGVDWPTVSVFEFEVYEGAIPDNRTDIEKIVAGITAPVVSAGDKKIAMPELPADCTVEFQADYEQVIGSDGTIYTPVETKTVKGFYEVSNGTDTARTSEFTIVVPGRYTDGANANAKPDVIPALQEWHGETGDFEISDDSRIVYGDGLEDTAEQFAEDYQDITGKTIQTVKGSQSDAKEGDFYLTLGSLDAGLGKEGYVITIGDAVAVEACEATGAYWGVISILQILKQNGTTIPRGITRDYPKYEVRGFMLDVGRKTFELDTVKEFAKNLAWYKMNNFHLHLSDNLIFLEDYATMEDAIENAYSGFRLESSLKNDEGVSLTSTDVYYTKDEFRSFIKDSRKIGVSIVPEFDMPAHALGITRVFQDNMTKKTGGYHSYLIEEMDITNPETTELAQSIWNDYFEGDDPVFDEETTVHIGTDEFHGQAGQAGIETFRKFSDDMIRFVQGTGRTVRMWGSLSNKSGTTPVTSENVQLNIWNTGYANPQQMYNQGYDLINTLEGYLYIVPSAGYYSDYLNAQYLYNSWTPNNFSGTVFSAGDDQILGGTYAIWNDQIDTRGNGISEYDDFDRFFQPLPSLSEKLWGEGTDRTYAEMREVAEKVSAAPNTNPYHVVDSVSEDIMEYSFDDTEMKDSSGNSYDITDKKNVSTVDGKSESGLQLKGGESYVETPVDMVGPTNSISMWVKRDADSGNEEQILCETTTKFNTYAIKAVQKETGKVGFSREGYDYSFDYKLPKDQWVYLTINGYKDKAELYVNNEYVSTAVMDNETKTTGTITATLILPVQRIGSTTNSFKGIVDEVTVSTKQMTSVDYSVLDREGWTVEACGEHSGEGPAVNAIDGDTTTFWHTNWAASDVITDTHNHYFEVTLPEAKLINKLSYLPRQNSKNGRIYKYDIIVTKPDGTTETVVENGTWADSTDEKYAAFDPIEAKKVRLVIKEAGADNAGQHGTIAELNLYQAFSRETAQALYDQYTELKKEDYTGKTWVFFEDAYAAMKDVLDDPESTSADYTSAYTRLRNAAENLVREEKPVPDTDFTRLNAAIADAEKMDLDGYTADSTAKFKAALEAAKQVAANTEAAQSEVDAALNTLQTAKAGLVKLALDVSKLNAAVTEADKLNLGGYTADSAAAFRTALANAKAVLAKADAAQDEIDKALAALGKAKAGLVKAALEVPTVPAKGTKFTAANGLIYKVTKSDAKNGTVAVVGTAKKKSKVTIPATVKQDGFTFKVTEIAAKAFQNNKKVTGVVIGANVTKIGSKAFYKCSKLKNITFKSKKAPKFGSNVCKGIKANAKVTVPKKMTAKQLNKVKKGLKSAGKKIKFIKK